MTYKQLAATVLGILFIVAVISSLGWWTESITKERIKKYAEEKQRIEQMEEENRLLKVKCSVGTLTWQMEYAK